MLERFFYRKYLSVLGRAKALRPFILVRIGVGFNIGLKSLLIDFPGRLVAMFLWLNVASSIVLRLSCDIGNANLKAFAGFL